MYHIYIHRVMIIQWLCIISIYIQRKIDIQWWCIIFIFTGKLILCVLGLQWLVNDNSVILYHISQHTEWNHCLVAFLSSSIAFLIVICVLAGEEANQWPTALLAIISTECALIIPMTYDNHPIQFHPYIALKTTSLITKMF